MPVRPEFHERKLGFWLTLKRLRHSLVESSDHVLTSKIKLLLLIANAPGLQIAKVNPQLSLSFCVLFILLQKTAVDLLVRYSQPLSYALFFITATRSVLKIFQREATPHSHYSITEIQAFEFTD